MADTSTSHVNLIRRPSSRIRTTQSPKTTWIVMLFLLSFVCSAFSTATSQIHTIHWNTSNPMFRTPSNNVIEINSGNHPWEYDQVNIVCPVYKPGVPIEQQEQYIIYSVSKEEYDSCRITQATPKIVALCNRPHELMYFTITFRSFTPTPGGLEFHPGHDYYFISTSSKNDLHRRVGGGCSSSNMKVIFRVAPSQQQESPAVSEPESNAIDHSSNALRSEEGPKQFPWSQESDFRRSFSYYYPSQEIDESRQHFRQSKKSMDYAVDHPDNHATDDTTSRRRQAEAMHSSALSVHVPYWIVTLLSTMFGIALRKVHCGH
ncbi:hypothetical protein TCAL_13986 [Tigriopus californicus]|uniref:Ephrin RBD domain-containing protein n=2 Tax=Tigriopus californicus TaxID=6832 RepID=A0A553NXY7_TIGCA|nr:hypothetical protein TCAL_13986 [Tigriopus californicus]|eukprot:TCALIF_13986-PA protein Name:"Similar to Efnb1 Ephrin-B1 (Mus musculus)" AED:0.35 eAED:0.43 QI:0/-1/0/1/-1/1/1/0/317